MKKSIILLGLFVIAQQAHAVVADPTPYIETLPDGRQIQVVLHGDEDFSYKTDLEGNIIEGNLPTETDMARINQRRATRRKIGGHFPTSGKPRALVLLANFKDVKFSRTRQNFEDMMMKSGYDYNQATGSCRDYFIACSDSAFMPQFDVFGPFDAEHEMEYYGGETGTDHDANAAELIIEMAHRAAESGVNMADYDTDNDGFIDNIFVYYAGYNQAEGADPSTIWPHASDLSYYRIEIADGKMISSYACTSELKGRGGGSTQCGIGTFCHEFSHVLGLPDWYDTSGGDKYTVGDWSIMASGNYNNNSRTPPSYNSYERFSLGWLKPQQLTQEGNYFLLPLTMSNKAYLIANEKHNLKGDNPNPKEFFLLENRQAVGWDEPKGALVGTGMLVWHIHYNPSTWANNTPNVREPMGMHLLAAGGDLGGESTTDPYPGTRNVTSFIPKMDDGTALVEQPVFNIALENENITFTYISTGIQHLAIDPETLDFVVQKDDNNKSLDWKAATVHITGWSLDPDEQFTISTNKKSKFYVSQREEALNKETSAYWTHSIVLEDNVTKDSTFDATFYVSYKAPKMVCNTEADVITISSDKNHASIKITGRAPRKTYVTTPQPQAESNITPYAFTINWDAVKDAEEYYLTLYQTEEGKSEIVQDFEKFNSPDAVLLQGWQSTTNVLTSSAKKDGQSALMMKKTGDKVVSETYNSPITNVSFWVNAFYASTENAGVLTLKASTDGEKWTTIDNKTITTKVKEKTYSYDFDAEKGYVCFSLEYEDLGGAGIALDAFTATMGQKVTYIYKGKELTIPDTRDEQYTYTFTGLQPNSTYSYQLQCTDGGKGCEEVVTAPSKAKSVLTLDGADPEGKNLTIGLNQDPLTYDAASRIIYLPTAEENFSLYVYNDVGRLIWSTPVEKGQTIVYLPDEHFVKGRIYIAKYTETDKMTRKAKWVKFIYK